MRFLSICVLAITPFVSHASELSERLDTSINQFMSEHHIPAANVGVFIPDQLDWKVALGRADTKRGEDIKFEDHFRVGSISKTFTATAILKLMDDGKLSLDDTIDKYVPNVPNGDKITIRNLANMTSGLANYTEDKAFQKKLEKNPSRIWKPQELLDIAFAKKALFKPGAGWSYNNTNYVLLGLVIEKVSGVSYHQYITDEILSPNDLSNTFSLADFSMPDPKAHGYTKYGKGKVVDVTDNSVSWGYAAGHMASDFADMKRWAELIGTGALYSKEANDERMKWVGPKEGPANKKYGLGLGNNNGWLMHMGTLPGYNCIFAYLPQNGTIFVVMVNSDMDVRVKGNKDEPADAIFKLVASIIAPDNIPL